MKIIDHQVIDSAIKTLFNKLNNQYALNVKFCGCRLDLIKFNRISVDTNYIIIK